MEERKTARSPLTKKQFYEIRRSITLAVAREQYDANGIAKAHSVSDETVRAVKRAGTWPQYERNKQARNLRRGRPVAGVRPGAVRPDDQVFIPRGTAVVALAASDLSDLKKRLKVLEDWHDSYQQLAEKVAAEALEQPAGGDGPETVNAHYAFFNGTVQEQPK